MNFDPGFQIFHPTWKMIPLDKVFGMAVVQVLEALISQENDCHVWVISIVPQKWGIFLHKKQDSIG
jgi:hypothetical protein